MERIHLTSDLHIVKSDFGDYLDIHLTESGILISEYKRPVVLDHEKTCDDLDRIRNFSGKVARLHLLIACPGLDADKGAKKMNSSFSANKYFIARAVLCDSLSHRVFGNLLFKFQQTAIPHKMFNNKDKALAWLKTFLQ